MRRVMCVWFPLWPVQRLRSEPPGPNGRKREGEAPAEPPSRCVSPLSGSAEASPSRVAVPPPDERSYVLFKEGRRGSEVVVYSPEVAEWGIRIGMPLGEVRSLLSPQSRKRFRNDRRNAAKSPQVPVLKRADPAADRSRLQSIALDCQAYSPLAGLEEEVAPEAIWLDISGSEALFGGERDLAEQLQRELRQQKFQVRIAIADSWGAAWAVSHFADAEISLIPPGQQTNWLAALPVAALRLSETVQDSLQTLNIVTIGQLLNLPRTSLPSRFGKELVLRLDQALGVAPELLVAERLEKPLFAEWLFEEPIADRQSVDHVCQVLLERLLAILDERRAGLRELACHWVGTKAEPTILRLLRPTTDRKHLLGLLRLQCERRAFTTGIQGVRMEVVEIGLSLVRQTTLFGDDSDDQHPQALAELIDRLIDRLSLRLGRHAVLRPRLSSDPQPEFACEAGPWLDESPSREVEAIEDALSLLRCRPLRLLSSPRPLSVQTVAANGLPRSVNQSSVVRISGPERIETGWWRGPDAKRDYYRLDLANGTTLWVFLERDTEQWFLHGLFM